MSRRVARVTVDNLSDLVGPCGSCVFWQLDPVRRERASAHESDELAAWVSTVLREWGSCGRIVYVDGAPAGHVLYAPPVLVPGAAQFPTAPASADAVLLVSARVDPAYEGGGLGRLLVQALAKDLIRRGGIRAIEAFGGASGRSGRCLLPADFLRSVGFRTQRAHPATPRMRMDLRSVLTWRADLEAALDRLLAPVRAPAPSESPTARAPRALQQPRSSSRPQPAQSFAALRPAWSLEEVGELLEDH